MALPDQVELLCIAVQKKAEEQAEEILKATKARHDRIVRQGISEIEREQEQKKLLLRREAFQDAKRKVDAAELKARRMVMAAREEIFHKILSEGRERLRVLRADRQEYKKLLTGMVRKAAEIIMGSGAEGIEIECRSGDRELLKDVIAGLTESLSSKVRLLESSAAIEGGIMAYSADGKQLVDLSFSSILSRISPEIRAAVAERLFRESSSA